MGEEVDALVLTKEDQDGRLILSKKRARFEKAWRRIEAAAESGEPVEGTVIEVVKGGLIIDLGVRGFLPASLVDIRRVPNLDEYMGTKIECKVIELNRSRNNVVLSRRAVLEEERKEQRQEILDRLQPGLVVEGQISNIVDFGAFVDLDGIDGLIHISELSWSHVNHPSEILTIGDTVQVKVLDIDRDRQRISLGLKQTQEDPWQRVVDTYNVGDELEGKVTKVVTFGAFVEILDGVEGLVHISELAHHHVENPREVVAAGRRGQVKILEIDSERRRLSLSVKRVEGQVLPRRRHAGAGGRRPRRRAASSACPRTCSPAASSEPVARRSGDRRRRPPTAGPTSPRGRGARRGRRAPSRPRPRAEADEPRPRRRAEAVRRGAAWPRSRRGGRARGRGRSDEPAAEASPAEPAADARRAERRAALTPRRHPLRRADRRHRRRASPRRSRRSSAWARRRSRPTPWSTSSTRAARCATRSSSAGATDVAPGGVGRPRRRRAGARSPTPRSARGSRACSGRGSARASPRGARRSHAPSRRRAAPSSRCRCCSRRAWRRSTTRRSRSSPTRTCARERAAARGHTRVDERAARQLTQDEKAARATYVVANDGTVEELEPEAVGASLRS